MELARVESKKKHFQMNEITLGYIHQLKHAIERNSTEIAQLEEQLDKIKSDQAHCSSLHRKAVVAYAIQELKRRGKTWCTRPHCHRVIDGSSTSFEVHEHEDYGNNTPSRYDTLERVCSQCHNSKPELLERRNPAFQHPERDNAFWIHRKDYWNSHEPEKVEFAIIPVGDKRRGRLDGIPGQVLDYLAKEYCFPKILGNYAGNTYFPLPFAQSTT